MNSIITLLLIDDDPLLLQVNKAILERSSYQVICADNGQQGLALFQQEPMRFSLIITDLVMPGMSGIEMLLRIRRITADTPALLLSGYSQNDLSADLATIGRCTFLLKPFAPNTLRKAISQILQQPPQNAPNDSMRSS